MYRFADFDIIVKHKYNYIDSESKDYITLFDVPSVTFEILPIDIHNEQVISNESHSGGYLEMIALQRKLAEWLPYHDAFVLHSACFDVGGVGVAFAAHSGTGKTTHMLLWQELLGERMTIVNGDKPIVRFFESGENAPEGTKAGVPYAYGTPWNGKEHLGCNMRTELKHICFIERSEENYVEPIEKSDAVNRIFNQVYMPKDPIAVTNTIGLIDRMLSCCKLWIIHCNMDISAAETAYNALFGKNV